MSFSLTFPNHNVIFDLKLFTLLSPAAFLINRDFDCVPVTLQNGRSFFRDCSRRSLTFFFLMQKKKKTCRICSPVEILGKLREIMRRIENYTAVVPKIFYINLNIQNNSWNNLERLKIIKNRIFFCFFFFFFLSIKTMFRKSA